MGDSNCGIRGEDYSNCSSLLALSIVMFAVGLKSIKLLFLIVLSIITCHYCQLLLNSFSVQRPFLNIHAQIWCAFLCKKNKLPHFQIFMAFLPSSH